MVSVIVPVYNAGSYFHQLCQSLKAQTYQNFEVLILDDGSTDDTRDVLAPFQKDNRFHLSGWKSNRGVSAATRELLGRIRGEYWCYPGADDVLLPDFLERRVELMESRRQAALAHGPPEIIDESGKTIPDQSRPLPVPPAMPGSRALMVLLQHNIISTSSVLVRSSLTRRVLPHFATDWRYAQDWYLWLLHASLGADLLWDSRPLHKYRVHPASLTRDPAKTALRNAEIRLVPLCALQVAAQLSPTAAEGWKKWRSTLYGLWLRRALKLWLAGGLRDDWMEWSARAYYGSDCGKTHVLAEAIKHGLELVHATLNEDEARRRQSFPVSGLAQIDDPLFR